MDIGFKKQVPFESGRRRAQWVLGIFIALTIVNISTILSGYAYAELINRAISGEIITLAEAISDDNREMFIGFVQMALYIAAPIAFLMWIYRAHRNLPSLHAADLRFTPGWAVGWFFIPIMSLFRPYQVASEIWKASEPKVDMTDGTSWKSVATSPIVGWWWAFFLISTFVANIALRTVFSGEELADLLTSTYAYMVSDAIDIVGILIAILVVRKISQFQETKYKLISPP